MEGLQGGDGMIRLLVKAPDQQIDDQLVKCELDWSVERLKDHLEEVYPSKPKRCEQKVIFAGQLLNDSMILKDVLQQYYNQTESTFIVHLVCKSAGFTTTRPSTMTEQVHPSVNVPQTPTQPSPMQQYYGQLNNQQMAWMQQAYAHYLTQYMQIMAAQGIQLQSTIPYAQSANTNISDTPNSTNNVNNNVEENEDNGRANGQDVADVANPPNNNNVGEDGEANANRDWLDIFDILARVVVLSSIVYFYSSPSRFLIVSFLGFAIYLIQGGFFRVQPIFPGDNNNGRMENNNQPGNEPQQPIQQPRANVSPSAIDETTNEEVGRTNGANEENERPGAWAFTWTFFSSFFASLIPEQPPVM